MTLITQTEQQDDTESVGRPTKYDPDYHPRMAKLMCNLGAIDTELAEAFEVSLSTINLWKIKHREFSESIKLGKEIPDERVKRSLYARAVGYSHPEDDIRTVSVGGTGGSQIVITPTVKHYPPDTAACRLWLENRCPDEFRVQSDKAVDLASLLAQLIATRPD